MEEAVITINMLYLLSMDSEGKVGDATCKYLNNLRI